MPELMKLMVTIHKEGVKANQTALIVLIKDVRKKVVIWAEFQKISAN